MRARWRLRYDVLAMRHLIASGLFIVLAGCGETPSVNDSGGPDSTVRDASGSDSGTSDSGISDSGTSDSGTSDSGTSDSGTSDSGTSDSGTSDSGTSDSGTSDSGTSDSAVSDGGDGAIVVPTGDCDSSADCDGRPCVELFVGGWRVCEDPNREATSCTGSPLDECCDSSECAAGACFEVPLVPRCMGVIMMPRNVCAEDQCADSSECVGVLNTCFPARVLGRAIAACGIANCQTNADCTAEPGGYCAPVREPCCGVFRSLTCIYPGDCRSTADCPSGSYCDVMGGRATCIPGAPLCPL